MQTAIVICTRYQSSRVPGKALRIINGEPCLQHLINRVSKANIPIIIAAPKEESAIFDRFIGENVSVIYGHAEDPLARMAMAVRNFSIKNVVRITHDKIIVEPKLITLAVEKFESSSADYLYSSQFTDGSAFEVISGELILEAASKYTLIEHISYAVKSLSKRTEFFTVPMSYRSDLRLLLDYEEDFRLMELIMHQSNNDADLHWAIQFLRKKNFWWARLINKQPIFTVYTCAKNASKYINECMGSVARQQNFADCEYVLIDDASTDTTYHQMLRFSVIYKNVKVIRNERNIGLASSSNIAIEKAKGKYVVRLDADDFFISNGDLSSLKHAIEKDEGLDVVYPSNYLGTYGKVQSGKEHHHVGGAIFSTRALNHVKFTEGLRGYEGYDLYHRAKETLKVGYLDRPTFFYRQHWSSMSKTNTERRKEIRENIDRLHNQIKARSGKEPLDPPTQN